MRNRPVKAVILAGGQGSRLRPLTLTKPKPLLPVGNKPIVEYALESLKECGVHHVYFTLHYKAQDMMSYFGQGADQGVRINYMLEDRPLGTAGAVRRCVKELEGTVLVVSGDALFDFDLKKALEFHREKKSLATMVVTKVPNPLEYGVAILDEEGRVEQLVEKPSWDEVLSDTVNTGIYILEKEIFERLGDREVADFSKDLFPLLLRNQDPFYAYVATGYWCDIGNFDQYESANQDLIHGRLRRSPAGEVRGEKLWMGKGVRIASSAHLIPPLVLGDYCQVQEGAVLGPGTILGSHCIIGKKAYVSHSIVDHNAYLGREAHVEDAILSEAVHLKRQSFLATGVVLGKQVEVGEQASVRADIKVWPNKHIEPGATLSTNLVWGRQWPQSVFSEEGILGLGNIEITTEFALHLAAAYGTTLEVGSKVYVSRDDSPASRLIHRSLICGLASVGVDVHDFRVIPCPVNVRLTTQSAARGAVHVRVYQKDPAKIQILFFDSKGVMLGKFAEREVEQHLSRQDFRRTAMNSVGKIYHPDRALSNYIHALKEFVDIEKIREANYKVVVDFGFGNMSRYAGQIFGQCGGEFIFLNAYPDSTQAGGHWSSKTSGQRMIQLVKTLKMDFGIRLDSDAEHLEVIDSEGNVFGRLELLVLMSQLELENDEEEKICLPVSAPSTLAQGERAERIVWSRTDRRSLSQTATLGQEKVVMAGDARGGFLFPRFSPAFDALVTAFRLMELLSTREDSLVHFWEKLEVPYRLSGTFDCPMNLRATLMKSILESSSDYEIDLTEGIKVLYEDSWVLLVPNRTRPFINFWIEGSERQQVHRHLEFYRDLVEDFVDRQKSKEIDRWNSGEWDLEVSMSQLQKRLTSDKAFHFRDAEGYTGLVAHDLQQFGDILHYIDERCVLYHFERGDLSAWLEIELKEAGLAQEIRSLRLESATPANVRKTLLELLRPYRERD